MNHHKKILIIESDSRSFEQLSSIFNFIDIEVDRLEANFNLNTFNAQNYQCIILGSPYSDGLKKINKNHDQLLKVLTVKSQLTPVVLIDKQGEINKQHELFDFVMSWPLRHIETMRMIHRCQQLDKNNINEVEYFTNNYEKLLIGGSKKIKQCRKLILQVAQTEATVLITGESGTGKEIVASQIHEFSKRPGKFVPVNCGAIPAELLESELFGHEKGAFTGAVSTRQGRFEMAKGGTLFLDEIGDMPHGMQVKLLRVLQERKFERVGSCKTIETDVRIVAATHQNLAEAMQKNQFREDLYYRINVFPIELPSLRARVEDIPELIELFIKKYTTKNNQPIKLLPEALDSLKQYRWPGNIRELANLVERLMIMAPGKVISSNDLPKLFHLDSSESPEAKVDSYHEGLDLKEKLNEIELAYIKQALDKHDGVVSHAAESLSMRRTTLVEKMRKYGLGKTQTES